MLNIINPEFDVNVGDKVFSVKALSLNSLLKLSKSIKNREYIKNAEEVCKALPKEQRGKFMMDVLQELGKASKNNEELEFADSLFQSVSGVTEIIKYAILRHNKIDEVELDNLIEDNFTSDSFTYLAQIAARILGVNSDEEEEVVEENTDEHKKKSEIVLEDTTKI